MSPVSHDRVPTYRSIADVPFFQATERGAKTAIRSATGTMTFAELDDRARRFATFVTARAGAGARVAILLPNVPEFAIAYFGAIGGGSVAVPVNYRLSPPEVGYIVSDCGAAVMVTTHAQFEKLAPLAQTRSVKTWVLVDGAGDGSVSFDDAIAGGAIGAPAPVAPDDVAVLLYTSGTTGFPKGAMLSHANTLFNARSCRRTLGYREDDVALLSLPLFHVTGLNSQLVAFLACGATLVIQREYDTRQMLELVSANRVTALFLVPAIYKLITLRPDLSRYDLSSVRLAAYGGAPMDPETIRGFRRILPMVEMHNCYGLTESSSLATVLPAELVLSRVESVGRAVPDTEAQVRGESGDVLPPGTPGELYLRGPNIVQGYFAAPEKTREAFRGGWLKTGDVARIDADGLVTILDRVKDMINRGGEKIYGLEVENVLYGYPGVAEAAVFGIAHPVFGEVPAACVVAQEGVALDTDAIIAHCRSRLADYKVPVSVRVVDRLPRNPGGKVLKKDLQRVWNASSVQQPR